MPFFTHVFEDNVFNIISMGGDSELQEKIKARNSKDVNQMKEQITVPQKFHKLVELVQTRRDIWYISDEKWKASTELHEPSEIQRSPGTLSFYSIPELSSLCTTFITVMAEKFPELKDEFFLRIQILEFSDKDEAGTDVSLRISTFGK
eukprot:NODE_2375_length_561_cov_189.828125_g1883_i0.p1 GENE.NODE_2375_length_561_cov_189.828125_g1883_i0~~NODE_2375_length_561_cov_189.828125_g1883_i0.p1  ORF type:complete len:166 (-),score=56.99 NODE_2375_length_561_cov_189.828125_g1883_i0:63-506(-)